MSKIKISGEDYEQVIKLENVAEVSGTAVFLKGGKVMHLTKDQADAIVNNDSADLLIESGEILNEVVKQRLCTDNGNYVIKSISDNCTYNTDAVEKNATYPVTYYNNEVGRGFYVGNKETTEPQVGDWWCNYIKTTTAGTASRAFDNGNWQNYIRDLGFCYHISWDGDKNVICENLSLFDVSYRKEADSRSGTMYIGDKAVSGVFIKTYLNSKYSEQDYLYKRVSFVRVSALPTTTQFSLRQITASDLLAYENTGETMGALFLSDSLGTSATADSKQYASLSPILVDGAEVAYKRVGNLYLTSSAVTGAVTSDSDLYEVLQDNTDLIGSSAISLASNEEGGEV